jgi:hypothetical protein
MRPASAATRRTRLGVGRPPSAEAVTYFIPRPARIKVHTCSPPSAGQRAYFDAFAASVGLLAGRRAKLRRVPGGRIKVRACSPGSAGQRAYFDKGAASVGLLAGIRVNLRWVPVDRIELPSLRASCSPSKVGLLPVQRSAVLRTRPRDEVFYHLVSDVIVVLCRGRLHKVRRRAHQRAANAPLQRHFGTPHGVNDNARGIG